MFLSNQVPPSTSTEHKPCTNLQVDGELCVDGVSAVRGRDGDAVLHLTLAVQLGSHQQPPAEFVHAEQVAGVATRQEGVAQVRMAVDIVGLERDRLVALTVRAVKSPSGGNISISEKKRIFGIITCMVAMVVPGTAPETNKTVKLGLNRNWIQSYESLIYPPSTFCNKFFSKLGYAVIKCPPLVV